jgi:hypothetical protein
MPTMKRPATFKQISRLLMDSWISSLDELADPECLYGPFRGMLRANMILLVIDTRSSNPEEFHLDFIKGYDLPTGLTDMSLLQRIVVSTYTDAVERQPPVIGRIVTRILDMQVAYDRIILPQKNSAGRSSWCVGYSTYTSYCQRDHGPTAWMMLTLRSCNSWRKEHRHAKSPRPPIYRRGRSNTGSSGRNPIFGPGTSPSLSL